MAHKESSDVLESLPMSNAHVHVVDHRWSPALLSTHARELTALYETLLDISQKGDLKELLTLIIQRAAVLLNASMGGIYLVRPDGQSIELVTVLNLPESLVGTVLRPGEGLSGKVAQHGETMIVDDYMHWEGRAAVYEGIPFRRVIGVPMKVEGKVIGVITMSDATATGPFNPEEVRLTEVFAGQAAIAFQHTRLMAEAQRRREQLAGLYDLTVAITGAPDRETLLSRLYEQAARVFRFDGFALALCQEDGCEEHRIVLATKDGGPVVGLQGVRVTPAEERLMAWVLRTQQRLLIKDIQQDSLPPGLPALVTSARSWMGVPMDLQDRVQGAVVLQAQAPFVFDETDLSLLEAMVRQVGIALERVRMASASAQRDSILEALADISQQLLVPAELERVLPRVLARLGQATGVSRCYIFQNSVRDDGTVTMSQRYEWVAPGIEPQIDNPLLQDLSYVDAGAERWLEELSLGRSLCGPVADFPVGERIILESQDILSIAVVPIFVSGRWWGFLGFDDCVRARMWSAAEIETLRSAAAILGAALARCEAEEAERQQRLLAEALRDTALSLAGTLSLDELLDRILANVQRVVPSDACSVMLIEDGTARVVRVRGYAERGLEQVGLSVALRVEDTPNLRYMATTHRPSVIQDTAADPNWYVLPTLDWIRSYLGVPIIVNGEAVGFLNLDFATPNAVPPGAAEVLQAFAAQAAVALANVRLYQSMEFYATQARQLALDLLHAQEAERRYVARELHDELGQALTALMFNLKALERAIKNAPVPVDEVARRALAEALQLAEQTTKRTRELSLDLRPAVLDELGLVSALRWYLDRYAARASFAVNFRTVGKERVLHPDVALAAYRIVQEATTNILRHANAQRVTVLLRWQPHQLYLEISDNGKGFDAAAILDPTSRKGSGLLGMQERAVLLGGKLEIETRPGRGTRIAATLPLTVDSSRLPPLAKATQ